jgi:hypothetical protein
LAAAVAVPAAGSEPEPDDCATAKTGVIRRRIVGRIAWM